MDSVSGQWKSSEHEKHEGRAAGKNWNKTWVEASWTVDSSLAGADASGNRGNASGKGRHGRHRGDVAG
jgi:hypothetical protein